MLYSHKHKCIFIHIPKCAGTSIERALNLNFVLAKSLPFTVSRWHCQKDTTIRRLGENVWTAYYKFSIVRNPWDRVISAWHMFESKPWCRQERSYTLDEFIDIIINDRIGYKANYITKWQKKRWEHSIENIRHHTLPATHPYYGLYENGNLTVDHCGRYETLQTDFINILKNLENTSNIELPHALQTNRYSDYKHYYKDSGLIRIIGEFYKKDCEYFGYEF